jgi:hypothetical protein
VAPSAVAIRSAICAVSNTRLFTILLICDTLRSARRGRGRSMTQSTCLAFTAIRRTPIAGERQWAHHVAPVPCRERRREPEAPMT